MKVFSGLFVLGLLLGLCSPVSHAALETRVLGFKHISNFNNPEPATDNTLLISNINPALSVWVCLYYVGLKQGDSREAYSQLALYSDASLLGNNPQVIKLMADELPNRRQFALHENREIQQLLDKYLDISIAPMLLPLDFNPKKVRVYSTTTDYTLNGHAGSTLKLSITSQQQQDFKPLALYAIVGQGQPPEALAGLRSVPATIDRMDINSTHQRAMGEVFNPKLKLLLMLVIFCGLLYMHKNR